MAKRKSFFFEAPSDEEIDHEAGTESDDQESGVADPELDPDLENEEEKRVPRNKKSQSPWDFSSYSESVVDEHSRRSTTSIDDKISKALKQHPIQTAVDDDSDGHSDIEPHLQEDFKPDEDDEEVLEFLIS
ncbi:DEAD-box ATP-dependent RNA helicase 28 [Dorcoceras hygrometricum]|uniref:DEAD-box ATP-dependent RNA helicase 28 n=1 Tax=Dorcoceras hygrometricum TaxID=472368 RepID=A0A2Z7BFW9_9LAMI|nr:DEAD-box ATP-dependent RNA helicase 28 [Dorcoceras hygrometricum]